MTTFENLDDRELLLAAATDRDAFTVLYRRHVDAMIRYFYRAVGRSDLALDLTAETFAAVLVELPRYRATAAPGRGWLYAIAHNRLVDSKRRGQAEASARRQLEMQPLVLTDGGEALIDAIAHQEGGMLALELVAQLPPEQRHAITARVIDDRDYAEIATEMGCSEQVIRKRVSRGLATLRRRLGERR